MYATTNSTSATGQNVRPAVEQAPTGDDGYLADIMRSHNQRMLRIPADAKPRDSGYLANPGDGFEIRLTVPGVYDYFCAPHEHAGMTGRIIVEHPAEAGTFAAEYSGNISGSKGWLEMPEEARSVFPPVETIMAQKIVRL